MESGTPAPWFVETDGARQGPFTSQRIMELVMDGSVKLDARVLDERNGTWMPASEAVQRIDIESEAAGPEPTHTARSATWQPPPRPTELKNVHVVETSGDPTGSLDYFALLGAARKQEAERARATGPTSPVTRSPAVQPSASSFGRSSEAAPPSGAPRAQGSSLLASSRLVSRIGPSNEEASPRAPAGPAPETRRIELEGISTVSSLSARLSMILQGTQAKALSAAAALAIVFTGSYGVFRMMAGKNQREPAAASRPANPTQEKVGLAGAQASKPTAPPPSPRTDALGSGHNQVRRDSGGVSPLNSAARSPLAPSLGLGGPTPGGAPTMSLPPRAAANAPVINANNEPPRDPPQYYSSASDPELNPTPPPASAPPANQAPTEQIPPPAPPVAQSDYQTTPAPDPNSGLVQPPGFYPPQALPPGVGSAQQDQGGDPNRRPTSY